jgi:Zn-dependent protease with chaperone function
MRYENPDVPHEVNVSRDSPVKEFFRLAAGLALLVVLVGSALYLGGGWLARLIPFETEKAWAGENVLGVELEGCGAGHDQVEAYLARLGAGLAQGLDLPAGMTVQVHYTEMDVPNAFATLGGHIVVTSGLYRRMPSENALAMVIGHEIGHLKARDPISALGGTATLSVAMAVLSGQGDALGAPLAQLVQRGYSRQAERLADEIAIIGLRQRYGHAGGGAALFQVLADYKGESASAVPSMLSTHPSDAERIARLERAAAGWEPERVALVPIEVPADSGGTCASPPRS